MRLLPAAVSAVGTLAMAVSDTSYRILRTDATGHALDVLERHDVAAVLRTPKELDSLAGVWNSVESMLASDSRLSRSAVERFAAAGRDQRYKRRFLPRGLRFDEMGRLWVQRSVTAGDSASIDVFSAEALLIGTVRLPPGTVVRQVQDGRLLVTTETGDGRVVIVEYGTALPN